MGRSGSDTDGNQYNKVQTKSISQINVLRKRKSVKIIVVTDETYSNAKRKCPKEDFRDTVPFDLEGLRYNPQYSRYSNELSYYGAKFRTLWLKQYEEHLKIANSLSTFLHGQNTNPLTLPQTKFAVKQIEKQTKISSKEMVLSKFAIGFTIQTSVEPLDLIKLYKFHWGVKVVPMLWDNEVYGARFVHDEYEIKIYSKTFEQRLHYGRKFAEKLLRIEIVMKQEFFSQHVSVSTMYDLTTEESWLSLFKLFLQKFDEIEKEPFIDSNAMPLEELENFILCQDERYLNALKKHNYNTYKSKRRRFGIKKKEYDNSIHDEVRTALVEQFYALLNGTYIPVLEMYNISPKRVQPQLSNQSIVTQSLKYETLE